jgi:hypothetical protein
MHEPEYLNTFIAVADDTKCDVGKIPVIKEDKPTIAALQYQLLSEKPYHYTQPDVLFIVHAQRNEISKKDWKQERQAFFSKSQACLRASPLGKTHGFGLHFNEAGKIALVPMESPTYKKMKLDPKLKQTKAMQSSRQK